MVKQLGALEREKPGLALPRDLSEEAVDVIPCACVLRAGRGLSPAPAEARDADHRPLGCRDSVGRWETRPHTEGFVYLISSLGCSNIPTGPVTEEARPRRGAGVWLAKDTCPGCGPVPEERRGDKLN